MESYDYIIAGGGCAGLSLAYYLHREGLGKRRVLIIDREEKRGNDRTWCFWTDKPTEFDTLIYKQWSLLAFADQQGEVVMDLKERRYQMLRSIDFYRFIKQALASDPQIHWRQAYITAIREEAFGACVLVDGLQIRGDYVFNSCFTLSQLKERAAGHHFLLQHFRGWVIRTEQPVFDSRKAVLMDFRTPQEGAARFLYVLPMSSDRALIEFTVFSKDLLSKEVYDQVLRDYIANQLNIQDYEIEEREGGAIPMTDAVLQVQESAHIINIGTKGGAVKPTTGYAFLNIQEQTRKMAQNLLTGKSPAAKRQKPGRFSFYDTLLLRILQQEGNWGAAIFSRLFRLNSMHNILTFLEEKSNLRQEVRIFASLPLRPFLKALLETKVLGDAFPALVRRVKARGE